MGKRLFDVIVGTVLALLALPVIIVCAFGLMLSLRAWPFFVQRRVGYNGTTFRFLKLRTLPPTAPKYADKYTVGTLELPPFAQFLRHLHLDELPQLFLVVAGKMSLVGPRPEMRMLHDQMPQGFAELRTSVRPGCTGLWQIGTEVTALIGESPVYDEFYVDNSNLRLDAWILARTLAVLVGRPGMTDLRDVPDWALRPAGTKWAPSFERSGSSMVGSTASAD
ncbi:MAG: sugar transferase [Acidimicrobiales bacterium]